MFCTSCGIKNAADSNFCKQCGGKLDRVAAAKINEDAFERAMPEDEQVSALLERAYRLRKDNNLDGAIALCQEVLRLRSDGTSAHSLLGQLYEQQGDREAAIREYERVLQLNPGSIADRVKLDELRGQAEQGSERKSHRVVMADPQAAPNLGYARFTSAGIAVVLFVLGGLVALQFRPRTAVPSTSASDTAAHPSATSANSPASAALNNNPGLNALQILPGTVGDKAAGNPNGLAGTSPLAAAPHVPGATNPGVNPIAPNSLPTPGTNAPGSPNPIVIVKQGPIRYVPVPSDSGAPAASRLPGIKPPKTIANSGNSGHADGSGNGGHIVLNGDPDVTEDRDKITMQVKSSDVAGKKNEGGSEGNGYSHIVLDKTPSGAVKTVSAPGPATTTESRSFLALGDEKKRQREYKVAIDAFTKSLASAGDQMGYVLQQRALCFQQLNELASAKSDFERAINEYHKLEARDPETARNGVRVCEKGIKSCGN